MMKLNYDLLGIEKSEGKKVLSVLHNRRNFNTFVMFMVKFFLGQVPIFVVCVAKIGREIWVFLYITILDFLHLWIH